MAWAVTADADRFDEAVESFLARTVLDDHARGAIPAHSRRQAFWIAGAAELSIVQEVRDEIAKAIESGEPFEKFRDRVSGKLSDAWGKENPARIETIFRNAAQTAYNDGRYRQMRAPDVERFRPFWMFDAVLDSRSGKVCPPLNKTVLPSDHPFWNTHLPPLHHRCRSGIRNLTEREAKRRGITDPTPKIEAAAGFGFAPRADSEWRPDLEKVEPDLAEAFSKKVRKRTPPPKAPPLELVPVRPARPSRAAFEQAGFNVGDDANYDRIQGAAENLFGRPLEPESARRILGSGRIPGTERLRIESLHDGNLKLRSDFDLDGKNVGTIERHFNKGKRGTEARNELFQISDALQGQGIAKRVLRDQIDEYKALGVSRVTLDASWTGRYTWGRMGFKWGGPSKDFRELKAEFGFFLGKFGASGRDAEKLAKKIKTYGDLVSLEAGGRKFGKEFVLGLPDRKTFELELTLDDNDANYRAVRSCLGTATDGAPTPKPLKVPAPKIDPAPIIPSRELRMEPLFPDDPQPKGAQAFADLLGPLNDAPPRPPPKVAPPESPAPKPRARRKLEDAPRVETPQAKAQPAPDLTEADLVKQAKKIRLTEAEQAGVRDYTTGNYASMRATEALTEADWKRKYPFRAGQYDALRESLKRTQEAVASASSSVRTVFRGLKIKRTELEDWMNMDYLTTESVASTSWDPLVGARFASAGNESFAGVLLKMDLKDGRGALPVQHISDLANEREVLLATGKRFKAVKWEMTKAPKPNSHSDILIVHLEEVDAAEALKPEATRRL